MPRGRPSANAVVRYDDGRFSVVVTYRPARASFRIVSGFRGGGPTESMSAASHAGPVDFFASLLILC